MEFLINQLDTLAEQLELDNLTSKEFLAHAQGALVMAEALGQIDRIEFRLLLDQALDISNKEASTFCDPEELMRDPEPISEGYDTQGYASE